MTGAHGAAGRPDEGRAVRREPQRLVWPVLLRRWLPQVVVVPGLVAFCYAVPALALLGCVALLALVVHGALGLFAGELVGATCGGHAVFVRRSDLALPLGVARWTNTEAGAHIESRRSERRTLTRLLEVAALATGGVVATGLLAPDELAVAATTSAAIVALLLLRELRCAMTPLRLVIPWRSLAAARRDGRTLMLQVRDGAELRRIDVRSRAEPLHALQLELVERGVELEAGVPVHGSGGAGRRPVGRSAVR